MRKPILLVIILSVVLQTSAQCDTCTGFTLHINAKGLQGKDTIVFVYSDCIWGIKSNKIELQKGTAKLSGNINKATEGIIFINPQSRLMDGASVIRFIIEPKNIKISFVANNYNVTDLNISGSSSQLEKTAWDIKMKPNEDMEQVYLRRLNKLAKDKTEKQTELAKEEQNIFITIDSLKHLRAFGSLKFVNANPKSYFSGYLLSRYKKILPIDTLTAAFTSLSASVKSSELGLSLLDYLLKKTNNTTFIKNNTSDKFYNILDKTTNLFDLSLNNENGQKIDFLKFRGKIIVIDFWASWCAPCLKNIPYLRLLIEEFRNQPIEFVSVFMEKDLSKWKSTIIRYNYPGTNLIDEDGLMCTFFKVLAPPRYMIFSPTGIPLDTDAPHPTNNLLREKLSQYLQSLK